MKKSHPIAAPIPFDAAAVILNGVSGFPAENAASLMASSTRKTLSASSLSTFSAKFRLTSDLSGTMIATLCATMGTEKINARPQRCKDAKESQRILCVKVPSVSVVEIRNIIFQLSRKTDAVDAITFLQSAHCGTDSRDLAYRRFGKALFYKDQIFWIGCLFRIKRIRNIPRRVLDKIIIRIKARVGDDRTRVGNERGAITLFHIEIERLEKPTIEKSMRQIGKYGVRRVLPLFYAEQNVSVIHCEMLF